MYRIIFGNFHLRPEPAKNLPGFVYKDQGPATGFPSDLRGHEHIDEKFLMLGAKVERVKA